MRKAAQQRVVADLANRRAFRISHPHCGWSVSEDTHAEPAKRLNPTVSRPFE